jgi:hypothetical protein
MDKTSRSEVQFGSLLDLSPEELEMAFATTIRGTSTPKVPKQSAENADSGIASLTTAFEELTNVIGQQNREFRKKLDEMELKVAELTQSPSKERTEKVKFVDDELNNDPDDLLQAFDAFKVSPKKSLEARPKMKPAMFDGSTSWEDYLAQFHLVADLNAWSDETKATYLAVSLSGPAREVLTDISVTKRKDFAELTQALSTRFGTENRTDMYRAALKTRTRKRNETLQELAQAIRRLTRNAYPQAPAELRETLAMDTFMDALEDTDTRWKIRQSRPSSLNQALDIAVELKNSKQTA